MVKSLREATVVSPPKVTSPVLVLNVPVDEEASKLPLDWEYPVIFSNAPPLVNLEVPAVNNLPSDKFKSAVYAPLLFNIFNVVVDAPRISRVVEPPVNGTLVSAMEILSNVLLPVNVWVVDKSAKVMVPAGNVAVVPPDPPVKVTASAVETEKLPAKGNVPVVHVGAPPPHPLSCLVRLRHKERTQ